MADGKIRIQTEIDNTQAKEDLENLNKFIESNVNNMDQETQDAITSIVQKYNAYSDALEVNARQLDANRQKVKELNAQIRQNNIIGGSVADSDNIKLNDELLQAEAAGSRLNLANAKILENLRKIKGESEGVVTNFGKADKEAKSLDKSVKSASVSSDKLSSGLTRGIRSLAKYALALFSIRTIYTAISKLSNSWLNSTADGAEETKAKLEGINTVLSNAIAPIVKFVVDLIAKLFGYVSALLKVFFGIELSTKNMSKNLGSGSSSAKDIKKSLAGFDEVNVLNNNSSAGSSGGSGSATPNLDLNNSAMISFVENVKGIFESLLTTIQPFIDTIMSIDLTPLINAFSNLWKALQPILNDLGATIAWFMNEILGPLIKWLAEEFIPTGINLLASTLEFLEPIISAIGESALFFWDTFLEPVANWTGEIVIGALDILGGLLSEIGDWMKNNQDLINNVAIVVTSFAIAWGLVNAAITIWNTIGAIATAVTTAFGVAVAFLTSPIGLVVIAIGAIIAVIALLIKNWDSVKEVAGKVWKGIQDIWNGVSTWFNNTVVKPIGNFFGGMWDGIKNAAANAWNWIISLFSKGGKIFSGVTEGIVNLFKMVVNAIIDGLNKIISIPFNVINGILNGIRNISVLGVAPFKGLWGQNPLPVPQIPKLARGGIVSRPTQAVIGEAGREAIIPLENNQQGIQEIASLIAQFMGQGNTPIIINLDGKKIAEVTNKRDEQLSFATNGGVNYVLK